MATQAGYYRYPTIHGDTVVFVSEDDLWSVPADGGLARRLTSNPGQASNPSLSPDGRWLAFTGRDEGQAEVYVMPAEGGPAERLTFLGAQTWVAGWSPDGQSVLFASNASQPFARLYYLYAVSVGGSEPERLPTGPAMSISYGSNGSVVIGRNMTDLARWKRYRGGLSGDLWLDPDGRGGWRRLLQLQGNVAQPLWVGERIHFVSDHQGVGNLYSCLSTGEDLRRHTQHSNYYVRHPATDGRRIVYHAGAELYLFDPATDESGLIAIEYHSPRVERKRKFADAADYLQGYDIHPEGVGVAVVTRGRPFVMANWEGPVIQFGEPDGVRYRLATWLNDGERLVMVSDAGGEETLEIHGPEAPEGADEKGDWTAVGLAAPVRLDGVDIGQAYSLYVSPTKDEVALTNHRHELMVVDLEAKTARVLDRSQYGRIHGVAWSPDGRWLAYSLSETAQTAIIKLCLVETGETWPATRPVLQDIEPAFDPDGHYLYFLSYREFDPVYDNLHFDLNFPWGMRPYLVTLQADLPHPFLPMPRAPGEKPGPRREEDKEKDRENKEETPGEAGNENDQEEKEEKKDERPRLHIDLEGIQDRIVAFPVDPGRYGQIRGIKDKVLYSVFPTEGALHTSWRPSASPPAKGRIEVFDLLELKDDTLVSGISSFDVSRDGKTLIYRAGNRLRLGKAGENLNSSNRTPGRDTGWLDLDRIRISVRPPAEWEQMVREAWRLQRDHFWTEDMSGVDWQAIYDRYRPLLQRVATRGEFSDLMWEMQGELGTSHAYEFGGDYRPEPAYEQALLAADFRYDPETDSYRLAHIARGDVWDDKASSPLARPGVRVKVGDRLVAVNGRRVGRHLSPERLLVNQAGNEVLLTFLPAGGEGQPITARAQTLHSDTAARYRQWVDGNRARVQEATGGRVGYVHVPDMGPRGYAEFHRGFLPEIAREGLIVDVRFNGGGHVSQLILEKLARRRLGYDVQRWGAPIPYPYESVLGPMVALTNEQAGSDGDMFSHAFKLMKLGPLLGKRTWGGVIGISPRDVLVDGSVTTQPEFSMWFEDIGWQLENFGTDPDIEIEYRPQDYVAGRDPQLERAIEEILARLEANPPRLPEFGARPRTAL